MRSRTFGPMVVTAALLVTPLQAALVTNSITYQSGIYSTAPSPLASPLDYINAFNALSGKSAVFSLTTYDGITNQGVAGTGSTNIGEHFQVTFTLGSGDAGSYAFRFGVEFGLGGVLRIDGVTENWRNTPMSWGGSYADPTQYLAANMVLGAGVHTVDVYGFENCCDGPQQGQWAIFQPFTTTVVPEPRAAMIMGLAVLLALALRRAARATAARR